MKRILSLVLAMVMVLGSFSAVFAAETTVADKAVAVLMDLGVLTEGKLDQEFKRQDTIVLLSRLMGEEEKAKEFPSEDLAFEDVVDPFYTGYVAWAVANELTQGKSATKFGFGDKLKTQELAMFILRVIGYDDVEYDDALAKAAELGLLVDVAEETIIKRGDMAVMTLNALGTKVKDSEKTLAEELGLELPKPEALTVKLSATGSKKLKVEFNKAVDTDKAVVTLKKGNIVVNTEKLVFAEDKMSAEINTITYLTKGDYTVSVAGLTEEVLTATVSVENEKIAKINLTSDKAPKLSNSGVDANKALVTYEVLNQYGEKMSNQSITWTVSTGKPVTSEVKNKSFVIEAAGSTEFIPGSVVYITGVHGTSGTVVNGQVEVVLASQANTVVFKGVYDTAKSQLADLPAGFAADKYVLLLEIMDQYGNKIENPDITNLVFTSNNPMFVASPTHTGSSTITLDNVKYTAVKLVPGSAPNNGGAVTIQAISLLSGKTSTFNLQAEALAVVKSFSMSAPDKIIAEGEKVEIPFIAIDQYGNAVTKFASLNGKVSLTGDGLQFVAQKDGSAKLYYTAPATGASENNDLLVYVTSLVTNGGDFSSLMLSIKEKAVATTITKVTIPALFENNVAATKQIGYANLTVVDQYNREFELTNEVINVSTAAAPSAQVVSLTGGPIDAATKVTFGGTATVGSVVYTFTIGTNELSAYNVTLGTVAAKDIVSYELSAAGTIYKTKTKALTLTGKTANGSSVVLVPTKVEYAASSNTGVATVVANKTAAGVTIQAVAKGEATISAWAGTTKLAEVVVTVSDVPEAPTTLSFDADVAYTVSVGKTFNMKENLTVKDQYGVKMASYNGVWTTSDASVATVDANGVVTGLKAKTVTIGFVTENGVVITQSFEVTEAVGPVAP